MIEYKYGIIYIRGRDEFLMQDIDSAFDYIPDESNDSVIYMKEPVPIEIGVKPVRKELLYDEDTEEWHLETINTAGTPYYDNGIIIDLAYHSNEDSIIHPYAVRRYDRLSDEYILLVYVDGVIGDNGEPVYKLRGFDGEDSVTFYDQDEYDRFLEDTLGNSNEIDIPFVELTEDNIASIGNSSTEA